MSDLPSSGFRLLQDNTKNKLVLLTSCKARCQAPWMFDKQTFCSSASPEGHDLSPPQTLADTRHLTHQPTEK